MTADYGRQPHVPQHRSSCSSPAARTAATRVHWPATTPRRPRLVPVASRPAARPSACRSSSSGSSRLRRTWRSCRRLPPTAAGSTSERRRPLRGHGRGQPRRPARLSRDRGGLRRRQGQRVLARQPDRRDCEPRRTRSDATGSALPNTDITANPGGQHLPQRSNFMVTAASRCRVRWRPARVPDLQAGRRLDETDRMEVRRTTARGCGPISTAVPRWPGKARTPLGSRTRATSTPIIPDGSGRRIGRPVHARRTRRRWRRTWAPTRRPTSLITAIRAQPLGAIIGSTPGAHGRAVARSAAGRRLRAPGCADDRLPAMHKDRRGAHLRRRERRHDPRDRRADRVRGVGIHSLQPAAEAEDVPRRSGGRSVRLLRRQLAEDRRGQVGRRVAEPAAHRRGPRRNVLSDLRRDRSGYGRRIRTQDGLSAR